MADSDVEFSDIPEGGSDLGEDSTSVTLSLPDSFLDYGALGANPNPNPASPMAASGFAPFRVPSTGLEAELRHLRRSKRQVEEALRDEKNASRAKIVEVQEENAQLVSSLRTEREGLEAELQHLRRRQELSRA
eukprot:CAMPEP_0118869578 /NCGR_PEP_ID=MMETSP1163-20130328/12871_1 /TAXON_ID=124430 /ORGANISM="Phaeomonas parva, Strain CCMP2877" /LENGTH=132 /DNA_ID=CAMNT_0006804483 /DNA_START=132 /DNA_END=527 /DNA_ORIENTATION=+